MGGRLVMVADQHERRAAPVPKLPQHRVEGLHRQAAARVPEVACGQAGRRSGYWVEGSGV